jgi:hypothetical protein
MSSGRWTNRLRVLSATKPLKVQAQNRQAVYNPLIAVANCSADYTPIIYTPALFCNSSNIPCYTNSLAGQAAAAAAAEAPNFFSGGSPVSKSGNTLDGNSKSTSNFDGGVVPNKSFGGVDGGKPGSPTSNAFNGNSNNGSTMDGGVVPSIPYNGVDGGKVGKPNWAPLMEILIPAVERMAESFQIPQSRL